MREDNEGTMEEDTSDSSRFICIQGGKTLVELAATLNEYGIEGTSRPIAVAKEGGVWKVLFDRALQVVIVPGVVELSTEFFQDDYDPETMPQDDKPEVEKDSNGYIKGKMI